MFNFFSKNKNIERSKQDTALNFLLKNNYFNNPTTVHLEHDFSIISADLNGTPSLFFIHAVMYPENMDLHSTALCMQTIRDSLPTTNLDEYDIYHLGIGLVQNTDDEKQKSVYKIGKSYLVAFGNLFLIHKNGKSPYGYSILKPVKLSSVSDEYWFMENLVSEFGDIIEYYRIGSMDGMDGNIIDEWSIIIKLDNGMHMVSNIYLDAYALEEPTNNLKTPNGFTLNI